MSEQPQPCPKCGAKAIQFNDSEYFRCSDQRCCMGKKDYWWYRPDWNSLRYVPQSAPVAEIDEPTPTCGDCGRPMQAVRPGKWQCDPCMVKDEQEPKPLRMQGNAQCKMSCDVRAVRHVGEHDEDVFECQAYDCKPVASKPRRMQGNPTPNASAYHWHEHTEISNCQEHGCNPVSPAPAAPDPGEGWELCEKSVAQSSWDKQGGCWAEAIYAYAAFYRRRRVEPEKAWEDVPLERANDKYGFLILNNHLGKNLHINAPSLRGFMGFVYAGNLLSAFPCRIVGTELEFPVAVRFAKHK